MFNADIELDCSGLTCPMPMLKLGKTVKKMDSGKVVHMITTDPGSKKDVPDWIVKNGHDLLSNEEKNGKIHFYIKKN